MQALALQRSVRVVEVLNLLTQVQLDVLDGPVELIWRGDKEVGGEDAQFLQSALALHGYGIPHLDAFDLVIPKKNAVKQVPIGWKEVYGVAFDAEVAAFELPSGARIERLDKLMEQLLAGDALTGLNVDHLAIEGLRIAHAIEAGDRSHHQDIAAATKEGRGGAQPQFLNLVVNLQVFLNVGPRGGHVGLGLVVVVVRDEILHRVVGEEGLELLVELRGQRFVVAENQGGALYAFNDVGDREGLAGSCYA